MPRMLSMGMPGASLRQKEDKLHQYQTVEEWLIAEHPGWLKFFRHPNQSPFWQRAKNNELSDDELKRLVEIEVRHNPGGATFGWCSMLLHARQAGKLSTK